MFTGLAPRPTAIRQRVLAFTLFTILVTVLPQSEFASASLRAMPPRPLTSSEQLSFSTAWSTAICRAHVVSLTDTLVPDPESAGQFWKKERYLTIRVTRWLKGQSALGSYRVGSWSEDAELFHYFREPTTWGQEAVFFLQAVPHKTGRAASDSHWPYPESVSWIINPGPESLPQGVLHLTSAEAAALTAGVEREVQSQQPTHLSQQSDLVLVGHPSAAEPSSEDRFTQQIVVDSVLAGDLVGNRVRVTAVVPQDIVRGPSVLFLKRIAEGSYQAVRPLAAQSPIINGIATRYEQSVGELAQTVRVARGGR